MMGWSKYAAVLQNDVQTLSRLLCEENTARGLKYENGQTLLHVAAVRNRNSCIKLLLNSNTLNVNETDDNRRTALHEAAGFGHSGIVSSLVLAGADVHARDRRGRTPLHMAANYNSVSCASLLICAGADLDVRDIDGCSPLHIGIRHLRNVDIVSWLLYSGASVDVTNMYGRTPLHAVVLNGLDRYIKMLLNYGASIHVRDHDGRSPLQLAMESRRRDRIFDIFKTKTQRPIRRRRQRRQQRRRRFQRK